jgi:Short C-terminal domain
MRQHRPGSALPLLLLTAALAGLGAPAQAGVMDFLFGSADKGTDSTTSDPRRRSWTVHEFTAIRLVAREGGSPPNQHPATFAPETLRQQLAQVRFVVGSGTQALFASDELGELVGPLVDAFAAAGPDDDLLLLSSSRRGGGLFQQPMAITARLFVQGGQLQLLVNDARYEFFNEYRGTGKAPQFSFGSRTKAGSVSLRSSAGTSSRADWLALPLVAAAGAAPQPAPAIAAPAAPAAAAPAPRAATTEAPGAGAPAPTTAAPALRPRDPGFADEVEQRLTTLKRLRDRGLISEEEYQQKRREILQAL